MCNSIAEGGGRCAAHIEAEIKNHKDNYNWEVIKAAGEVGHELPSIPLTEEEEKVAKRSVLSDEEHKELIKKAADASAELNQEFSKYAFVLSTKDETQVARYLYLNSDAMGQSKADMARAEKLYDTRLLEIDYNAEAQAKSGIEKQEARTPSAAYKASMAEQDYARLSRKLLQAEDKMMASMREAEAKVKGTTELPTYDRELRENEKRARLEAIAAGNQLKWAKRELEEAEDFDRRNFHAVFNPDEERRKAKAQFQEIRRAIAEKSQVARVKATTMAPYAVRAFKEFDKSSMNIPQGPDKGKLPEGLARREAAYKEAVAARDKSADLLAKKARREMARKNLSKTPEFKEFEANTFKNTERGKNYIAKGQYLAREFSLTEKYEKQLVDRMEKAKAEGRPHEFLQDEVESTRQRRALHQTALKNAAARALINS